MRFSSPSSLMILSASCRAYMSGMAGVNGVSFFWLNFFIWIRSK